MAQPLTPQTLVYELKQAADPQIAPDGQRIIYALTTTDPTTKNASTHLWLCDNSGKDKRQLTWSGSRNSGARWSPDGVYVAFISDRVPDAGIFLLPSDGGEARELTHHGAPISELSWSPDGTRIAYTVAVDPENPAEEKRPAEAAPRVGFTTRIDYKQDNYGYLNDLRRQVFTIDVATGASRQVSRVLNDHQSPQWSPDGRRIAAQVLKMNTMTSQLALIDVETSKTALVGPEAGVVTNWAWSPRGDRVVFAGEPERSWQTDFFLHELASGETRRVTTDLQCLPAAGAPGIEPPSQPVWLDERKVLFHGVRGGQSGLYVVDLETGETEMRGNDLSLRAGLSVDRSHQKVVQGYSSLERTGEVAAANVVTGGLEVITDHNFQLLTESPPALWERFDIARAGLTTEAWLLKPPDFDPSRRYPLILDVHGGPNGYHGYGFNAVQQCLATNGFVVVFANPRGSGSYGRDFTQRVTGDWGGEDFHDLMAVVDRALEAPYVDADRIGIWGYSYGGYMTAWTIGQTNRFKAAVCGAPCFDLESMYGTSDISHEFGELQGWGRPHEAREWYATHSPSEFAHLARTPTLLIHGEADERCPIGQSEQMFVALKKAGCEVAFARYPGGSHQFIRTGPPEHREDMLARMLDWFKHHLGEPR